MRLGPWIAAGAAGAAGLWLLDRVAMGMLQPPERAYPRAVEDAAFRHEELTIPSGRHALHGWLLRPREAARSPAVVLVHGWASNSGRMLDVGEPLVGAGHPVVLVDLRSHGRSGRSPHVTLRHYRDDVASAVAWTAGRFPALSRVVGGHSLGGGVAVVAVAEGAPADGVVLMGAPADIIQTWADYMEARGIPGELLVRAMSPFWRFRAGVPMVALRPELRLLDVTVPVLVLHGEEDSRVGEEHARRLARAAGTEVRVIRGADHTAMLSHPDLHREILAFLGRLAEAG